MRRPNYTQELARLRLAADHPKTLAKRVSSINSYRIDDDLSSTGAVEVSLELIDGRKRWCFFVTPSSLAAVGDWVPGTHVPHHIGERHMIVVGELTESIVGAVLMDLDRQGLIERHTLPLE